ncbi:MAG: ABC transporter permease [Bacteroidaceae bacterium]|nr:ABC transporter permease [Bacteroidaceae bacterium]
MKTILYAIRFLSRSKSYTIINLLGLAFSLACCIILMRYIHRELTVDTHCVDRDRTVMAIRDINGTRFIGSLTHVDNFLDKEAVRKDDILQRCSFINRSKDNLIYNEQNFTCNLFIADSTFFYFFDYPVVAGEARLTAPDDAVLTQRFAERVFGKESPVGKSMTFNNKIVTVRGVIDEPKSKSSLNFDALVSIHLNNGERGWGQLISEFVHLSDHVDLKALNAECNVYQEGQRGKLRYEVITLRDAYERTNPFKDELFHHTNMTYIYLLSGVALLLFLVGILNFVNIYMVLMMTRSKEYGIKKVFGLQGFPLFVQIWLENLLLIIPALLVAWLLIEITQIPVNRLFQEPIGYTWFDLHLSLGFVLGMPVLTAIYPYIRYNYRTAITSMRSIGTNRQSVRVRMAFLFVQYILTIGIIVVSLYFGKHLDFLQSTPPGFRTENILMADLQMERKNYGAATMEEIQAIWKRTGQLRQKLNECPYIENYMHGAQLFRDYDTDVLNDKDQRVRCITLFTSAKFFKIFDIPVVEGEIPDAKDAYDYRVVLNRAAMKAFGYTNLSDAFIRWENAQWFYSHNGQTVEGGKQLMPVTAVVEDFYSGHLTEGIQPMAFILHADQTDGTANIRIRPGQEKACIDYLKEVEKEIYNNEDFQYTWLKDKVLELYEDDRQVTIIYSVFALIAIAVSCLGLFGISLFDIRQRYREIALRKVHGAGMKDLYQLLFKKYLTVLGASFVVAVPLAYYLIHQYTADFVVKAPVGIGIFVIALLLVALISMGTLWWQIRKAANIDPATVMKRE